MRKSVSIVTADLSRSEPQIEREDFDALEDEIGLEFLAESMGGLRQRVAVNGYLVYFAGYASLCDSSGSRYWYADGRGWGVDGGAETVSCDRRRAGACALGEGVSCGATG